MERRTPAGRAGSTCRASPPTSTWWGLADAGPLLDAAECAALVDLYDDDALFRSTVDMARHRFG